MHRKRHNKILIVFFRVKINIEIYIKGKPAGNNLKIYTTMIFLFVHNEYTTTC